MKSIFNKLVLSLFFSGVLFFALGRTSNIFAATRTWDGGGATNSWDECANWDGPDLCPTSSDAVVFSGTSTKDSSVTIGSNFLGTITSLSVNSGYTGTITQTSPLIITSTMSQSAGHYTASNQSLSVGGTFTMNAGSDFTASSGTTTISAAFTINGGTFTHNSGTVDFSGGTFTLTCNNIAFNLVSFAGQTGAKTVGSTCSLPLGATPTIPNILTLNGTLSGTGTLTVAANTLTLNSGAVLSGFSGLSTVFFTVAGATADLSGYTTFTSSANTTISSGSLSLPSGSDINGSLIISGGTFTAPSGTLNLAQFLTISGTPIFNANGGTFRFDATAATLSCNNVTFSLVQFAHTSGAKTVNSDCSLPLGSNPTVGSGTATLVLSGTLSGTGTLTTTPGLLTLNTGSTLSGFSGLAASSLTVAGATPDLSAYTTFTASSAVTVSSGSLSLPIGADLNGNLVVSGGTVVAPNGAITLAGNLTHSSGTLTTGTGTITFDGGNQVITGTNTFYNLTKSASSSNSLTFPASTTQTILGSLTLQGTSADLLLLISSSTNTQWSIDAQGSRTLSNINVRDSNNINSTTMSGTNIADNGNNTGWTFSSSPSSGSVYYLLNGADVWVRGSISTTKDIAQKYTLVSAAATNNANILFGTAYIVNSTTFNSVADYSAGTSLANGGDDSTPINTVNVGYIAEGHGLVVPAVTSTGHDKTSADIGSTWTDGTYQYILAEISGSVIAFYPLPTGTPFTIRQSVLGTLTHVSGATNTSNITVTSQTIAQKYPIVKNLTRHILANGVTELSGSDQGYADSVDLTEEYDLIDPSTLATNNNPFIWNDTNDIWMHVKNVYHATGGNTVIHTTYNIQRNMNIGYFGIIQSGAITAAAYDHQYYYIPKTKSIDGYNFKNVQLLDTAPASQVIFNSTYIDSLTNPPDRQIVFLKRTADSNYDIGFAFGYSSYGATAPVNRSCASYSAGCWTIFTTKKTYPVMIGGAGNVNNVTYDAYAYRQWIDPTPYDIGKSVYWNTIDGHNFVYLDYHRAATNDLTSIPSQFLGYAIRVVESENLSISESTIQSAGIHASVTSGTYGYAVIELTSSSSTIFSFFLDYPSGNSHITDTNPTFRWKKATDNVGGSIVKYQLYIDKDNSNSDLFIDNIVSFVSDVGSNNKTLQYKTYTIHDDGDYLNLTLNPEYYRLTPNKYNWRIVAFNSLGLNQSNSADFWIDSASAATAPQTSQNALITREPDEASQNQPEASPAENPILKNVPKLLEVVSSNENSTRAFLIFVFIFVLVGVFIATIVILHILRLRREQKR